MWVGYERVVGVKITSALNLALLFAPNRQKGCWYWKYGVIMYVPGCGGGAVATGGVVRGRGPACCPTCHIPCVCGYMGIVGWVRGGPPACRHAACCVLGDICRTMLGCTKGARNWRGGGGTRPDADGRMVLCIPPLEPPIVFCLVALRLWASPGLAQVMLLCMSSMSPPWVWQ